MKIHGLTAPSWLTSIALASSAFLLCTASAFADPSGRAHGSPHGYDGHHQKASYQGRGDHHSRSFHHDGMHKRHGGAHHEMRGSGHGRHHTKGHDGFGSTHPRTHQGAMEFIKHILKFKEGMSLTAEQEQQLHALKTNYKKTRIKTKAEVDLANIDLHEVLKNEKASLSEIEAQFNNLHALKTKLYMASIKAKRDAKAVLSDEQRSRMDKIHERIKAHGGNMGHQGGYSKHKKNKDYDK